MPQPTELKSLPAPLETSGRTIEHHVTIALLVAFTILQLRLIFTLNINWDEFFFLSHIYSYQDGRLYTPFQTFHVHLFGWLTSLPLSEPDQIITGRIGMFLAELVTMGGVFLIARELTSARHAVFAVLAYSASGYVIGQGVSFRADPTAAALMMAALTILFIARERWFNGVLAAFLAALGLLITIKSVLYLPAFAAAFVYRLTKSEGCNRTIVFYAGSVCLVALLYGAGIYFHTALLATPEANGTIVSNANAALEKTVLSQGLFPMWGWVLRWLLSGLIPAVLILLGLAMACRKIACGEKTTGIVFCLLFAPLLSVVFYRNAFPYFFPFIVPPAAILAALTSQWISPAPFRIASIFVFFVSIIAQFTRVASYDQDAQRRVISTVHQVFQEPVPYIDRSGMIPSFPKAGFFMSTWGVEGILASGKPVMEGIIKDYHPPLLIANSPVLLQALDPATHYDGPRLMSVDENVLRETYRQFWGPMWMAGLDLPAGSSPLPFVIRIPGQYSILCKAGMVGIDGDPHACGSTAQLSEGRHSIVAKRQQVVKLRWGHDLRPPVASPPASLIFYGF